MAAILRSFFVGTIQKSLLKTNFKDSFALRNVVFGLLGAVTRSSKFAGTQTCVASVSGSGCGSWAHLMGCVVFVTIFSKLLQALGPVAQFAAHLWFSMRSFAKMRRNWFSGDGDRVSLWLVTIQLSESMPAEWS